MARHERVSVRVDCDGCGASEIERDAIAQGWRRVDVAAATIDGEHVNSVEVDLCAKCLEAIVLPGVNEKWRPL